MTAAVPELQASALEARLRRALAATSLETPRPLAKLSLPPSLNAALSMAMRAGLRPASVLVPVIRRGDLLSVLLTVRAPDLRAHGGQIAFPGGSKDASDITAVDTALREAAEEVGIEPQRVEVLGYLDDYPTVTRFLVTPVVGLIVGDPAIRIDAREVAGIFELPLDVALDPASWERKLVNREGLQVPLREVNWSGYRIWGATAGMLEDLVKRVTATP